MTDSDPTRWWRDRLAELQASVPAAPLASGGLGRPDYDRLVGYTERFLAEVVRACARPETERTTAADLRHVAALREIADSARDFLAALRTRIEGEQQAWKRMEGDR